jgi:3-hydroxyisobutyrate dehydrogenase-like beta-hydroxyacid dehydrogenase
MILKPVRIGFIGFGEAAQAFVGGWRDDGIDKEVVAYDLLFDDEQTSAAKLEECRALDVTPLTSATAVRNACDYIISAVTADQIVAAAESVGELGERQRYLDINSAAPEKKKTAAAIVGDGYLDLAVLSPVYPKRHASPILVCGPYAATEQDFLAAIFPDSEVVSERVGEASLVKMIRSVFVKGIEAVAAECALAAYKTGLADRVFPSLDIVLRHNEAKTLTDYTMERVAVHGTRRATEMEEVCATLAGMGLPSHMSQASAQIQRLIGEMKLAETSGGVPEDARAISNTILERLSQGTGPAGRDGAA